MRKFLLMVPALFFAVLLLAGEPVQAASRLQEVPAKDKVVIVIDPGHGGNNLGTTQNNHTEKFMTMTTALAMYEELLLYDNVEVYLTRTDDRSMTLKARAEFASQVNADFLFSVHYNASETHESYGAEVWASAFQPYNGYGYQFGYEILTDMKEAGLLVRGVKTRLGDKELDYYGIIREAVALEIPAVIIEHCHVDEERDADYCDSDEKLEAFGRMDATAVARYFGLKSSTLGVDYSDFSLTESSSEENVKATFFDTTEPDICRIAYAGMNEAGDRLALSVTAADHDSTLMYYSYSLDGGKTFQAREAWPESDALNGSYRESFILNLNIQPGTTPEIVVRAYNMYDLYTESNCYIVQDKEGIMPTGKESDGGPESTNGISIGNSGNVPENGTKTASGTSAGNGTNTASGTLAGNGTNTASGTSAGNGTNTASGTSAGNGTNTASGTSAGNGTKTDSNHMGGDGTKTDSGNRGASDFGPGSAAASEQDTAAGTVPGSSGLAAGGSGRTMEVIPVNAGVLDKSPERDIWELLPLCLVCAGILLIILTVFEGILYHNRKKRRDQARNDFGNVTNQIK